MGSGTRQGPRSAKWLRRGLVLALLLAPVALYGVLMLWAVSDDVGFSSFFCEHPTADSVYGDPVVGLSGIDCRWDLFVDDFVGADGATRALRRPAFPVLRWVVVVAGLAALVLVVKWLAGQRTGR